MSVCRKDVDIMSMGGRDGVQGEQSLILAGGSILLNRKLVHVSRWRILK